jgi:hypothetical protein
MSMLVDANPKIICQWFTGKQDTFYLPESARSIAGAKP